MAERKQCPFYGFESVPAPSAGPGKLQILMIDQPGSGSQCALIRGFTPCLMQELGDVPVWESCPLRTSDFSAEQAANIVEGLKQIGRVYPDESPEPDGVPFATWYEARTAEVTPP